MDLRLVAILVLLLGSAFFSGSETALFSLDRLKLRRLQERQSLDSWFVQSLLQRPKRLLQVILTGNEVINTSFSVLVAAVCIEYLNGRVPDVLLPLVPFLVATPAVIIIGEIIPKALAWQSPEGVARFVAPGLTLFSFLIRPIQLLIDQFVKMVVPLLTGYPVKGSGVEPIEVDEETFRSMLEIGQKEGVVEAEEREFIDRVLELDDISVSEIMTPARQVVAIPDSISLSDALKVFREQRLSRIPVHRDQDERAVTGILYAKDLLKLWKSSEESVQSLIRPAYFVPDTKRVAELLRDYKAHRIHIAIVVDEYGRMLGVVTMRDIEERLFGARLIGCERVPEEAGQS